jgi:hypothetical protein
MPWLYNNIRFCLDTKYNIIVKYNMYWYLTVMGWGVGVVTHFIYERWIQNIYVVTHLTLVQFGVSCRHWARACEKILVLPLRSVLNRIFKWHLHIPPNLERFRRTFHRTHAHACCVCTFKLSRACIMQLVMAGSMCSPPLECIRPKTNTWCNTQCKLYKVWNYMETIVVREEEALLLNDNNNNI